MGNTHQSQKCVIWKHNAVGCQVQSFIPTTLSTDFFHLCQVRLNSMLISQLAVSLLGTTYEEQELQKWDTSNKFWNILFIKTAMFTNFNYLWMVKLPAGGKLSFTPTIFCDEQPIMFFINKVKPCMLILYR